MIFIRTFFKTYLYYGDFKAGLFESSEYKEIATLRQLELMATTYVSEKRFSYLVKLMGVRRRGDKGALDFEIWYFPIHFL